MKLELKRKNTVKGRRFSDIPYIRDRRGRVIYKWDAHYAGMSPRDLMLNDVWELAEYLDERRKAKARTMSQVLARGGEWLERLLQEHDESED